MEMILECGTKVLLDDDRRDLAELPGWYLNSDGYVVRWNIDEYRVDFMHHLALGVTPSTKKHVDHKNRQKLDNRSANLRETTPSQNAQNRGRITSRGTYRGVYWNKGKNKWRAQATIDYKKHHVGYFDNETEAAAAVSAWRAMHMTHADADRA